MPLTKFDIIDAIAKENGYPRNKASETTETLLGIIKRTLASGEDVLVSGFGKFCVKERKNAKAGILHQAVI